MALDEVARRDLEALEPAQPRRGPLERDRDGPEDVLGGAAERAARDDEQRRDDVERRQPHDRAHHALRGRAREEERVDGDDRKVGEPEREPAATEGVRRREREQEVARHAAEQQQPAVRALRRNGVREPGVAAVHPPDQREHQLDADDRADGRLLEDDVRELGDREDEDEVEEQLERRDSPGLGLGAHPRLLDDRLGAGGTVNRTPGDGGEPDCPASLRNSRFGDQISTPFEEPR